LGRNIMGKNYIITIYQVSDKKVAMDSLLLL
jgi:hypothetical protein